MKVAVIGMGYVGTVTAAVLAEAGNEVVGVDVDAVKIRALQEEKPLIHEPGLVDVLSANGSRIRFSTSYDLIMGSEICIICVPTPNSGGRIDLKYVRSAAGSVADINPGAVLVIKSTVLPGTAETISSETGIKVVSNPEFTKEGSAVEDTRHPDRIVIGYSDRESADLVSELWKFTGAPVLMTNNRNAELIKYASNAFLAVKISFINEIANLCEKIPGGDVEVIAKGMGMDRRIAPYFLRAGIGYGGSCFPKDTEALISFARENNEELRIVEAAREINETRIPRFLDTIRKISPPSDSRDICVLGITFKDSTNDVRESPAASLMKDLIQIYRTVYFYDPQISEFDGAVACSTMEDCISRSDTVVIATEWQEFRDLEKKWFHGNIIDGKRILDVSVMENVSAVGLGNGKNQ